MLQQEKVTTQLLEEIRQLNQEFYGNILLEWYLNPNISNAICVCYRDENNNLKGYILATCISEVYYNALIKGLYMESLEDSYILYVDNSPYWYINSVVVAKEYQKKGIALQLLELLLTHKFEHLCAITITQEGKALLSKYLNIIEQISDDCFILEKENVEDV